ncbi:uncharacterized protein LOC113003829 isoform X2 [Solenopsis invicta]|uniref:uncharacterized protein LOC113003829 isoform X2 n=1 Tax=Solenopsis invicta TaxID=13686 RepID=UPI00193CD92F|nr:uncharacterized protein LOC113003829 isoform X2 [Solenopsis invicta]
MLHIQVGSEKIMKHVTLRRKLLLAYTPSRNLTIKINDSEKNIKIKVVDVNFQQNEDESIMLGNGGYCLVRRVSLKWTLSDKEKTADINIESHELSIR